MKTLRVALPTDLGGPPTAYEGGGILTQKKEPSTVSFRSFEAACEAPGGVVMAGDAGQVRAPCANAAPHAATPSCRTGLAWSDHAHALVRPGLIMYATCLGARHSRVHGARASLPN